MGRSRVFISYKRGVEPDESLALLIHRQLSQAHEVFIDQKMAVGTPWAQQIELELRRSDFLVIFISAHSVESEMVLGEIETAHRLMKEGGRPMILPVRLAYRAAFTYPLSAYLNPINWACWDCEADTPRLIAELDRAIEGASLSINSEGAKQEIIAAIAPAAVEQLSDASIPRPLPSAQVVNLEPAEGTMDPESGFYVERDCDAIARRTIARQGVTITIKGPRQMGKSSLLMRVIEAALQAEKRVVFIDFQLFDQDLLNDADRFYRLFCTSLSEQLDLEDRSEDFWQQQGGNNQRCSRYLQSYLLPQVGGPLLLAMDEVDRLFDAEFRSDFFSMLRSWHNNRALPMARIWKQLDLALVTATEPYHLIANLNQSPFNVGEVISLCDFSPGQVANLNQLHGTPLNPSQEELVINLLNGHPYLVRRALYLISAGQLNLDSLLDQAASDYGPFGDHLRYHLFRIVDNQELVRGLLQVIRAHSCSDEKIARLLIAAGLVRRQEDRVIPRCRLYGDYFGEHLHG